MRYFIDTEFIEYPCTIDLISIGIVCEDGREFYAISKEFDPKKASEWVKENVLSSLPGMYVNLSNPSQEQKLKQESLLWKSRAQIKNGILKFIGDDIPEFWGYYADYDWVVFCWLFGSMIDLPKGWPMYCLDLKQLCDDMGNPKLPEQGEGEHDALEDAKWNMEAYNFLTKGTP